MAPVKKKAKKRHAEGEEAVTVAEAEETPEVTQDAQEAEVEETVETEDKKKPRKKKHSLPELRRKKLRQETPEEKDSAPQARPADEEEKRRAAQKEMQQLVVRLRKEGKTEQEIKVAKYELKQKQGDFTKPDSHRAKRKEVWKEWIETKEAKEQVQENKERQHDLVVIPVVWRGRHDMEDVMSAAEAIKACVAQQGVDCWVDARRHYKPGQKFAHWEYRGVMLRVEIGPDDIKAGICRVCRAKTPGDFQSVERKRVRLPPAGARSLLLALQGWGLKQIEIERRDGDSEEEEEAANATPDAPAGGAAPATSKVDDAEKDALGDLEGNWKSAIVPKAAKKVKTTSGKKRSTKKRRKRRLQD